jgi:hypothetical protein
MFNSWVKNIPEIGVSGQALFSTTDDFTMKYMKLMKFFFM